MHLEDKIRKFAYYSRIDDSLEFLAKWLASTMGVITWQMMKNGLVGDPYAYLSKNFRTWQSLSLVAVMQMLSLQPAGLAHAKELVDSRNSYKENIAVIMKHHEGVIEVLNKNHKEAIDNGQELQQSLDCLRLEFQAALAVATAKETL
ncbi:hypothetical protein DAPPUDRAFT_237886 [Daphnia pulex]|uniref:Uncharacterized protein n=1 Tax=Daphnia pulex TaxID=6669 RepID=E9G4P0_DAPPU|nr:hypothetical protein DAPPUDRAFT_237886 [Daphnia pulex]|eukprot:EFX85334.1 hypothetical protein DAPPUDRAFT_237886 [Daphnia pulex]